MNATQDGQNNRSPTGDSPSGDADERTFWTTIGSLYRHRRFIVGVTGLVAILSVVVSLSMPDQYRASTRLLPPEGGLGTGITGMMSSTGSNLGSVAQTFLGQTSGDYLRFLSILSSRQLMGKVVDRFNLTEVYETSSLDAPRVRAIQRLEENTYFVIDDEYEYLSIEVYDQNAQRAADIANEFTDLLNQRHTELSSKNASNYRRFIERRYRQVQADLDSARRAKQQFEEEHGVIQLPDQARQFLTSLAELRTETIQNEIRLQALRAQYGPSNSRVNMAEQMVAAAREQQEQMMGGEDVLLPVSYQNLPRLSRQYAEIMQEVTIQEQILQYVRPLYEQARFDEQREKTAVQVIDPAVPPVEPSWPVRSVICIVATISGFLLAILGVLGYAWIRRNRSYLVRNVRRELPSEKESEPAAPTS